MKSRSGSVAAASWLLALACGAKVEGGYGNGGGGPSAAGAVTGAGVPASGGKASGGKAAVSQVPVQATGGTTCPSGTGTLAGAAASAGSGGSQNSGDAGTASDTGGEAGDAGGAGDCDADCGADCVVSPRIEEFPLPFSGWRMTPGSLGVGNDNKLWVMPNPFQFGVDHSQDVILFDVLTTASQVYALPIVGMVADVAPSIDGKLWFTEGQAGKVGRFAPNSFAETALPGASAAPGSISLGPNGDYWVCQGDSVARLDASGVLLETVNLDVDCGWLIFGPDGTLWSIVEEGADAVFRAVTPNAAVATFRLSGVLPQGFAILGNALWMTVQVVTGVGSGAVLQVDPAGAILATYRMPDSCSGRSSDPDGIVAGPDGNVWFTDRYRNTLNRLTPAGVLTPFQLQGETDDFPGGAAPADIVLGSDGKLWFTETGQGVAKIASIKP
jgi:streptogramin lyase